MLPHYTAPGGDDIVLASAANARADAAAPFPDWTLVDSGTSALIVALADSLARRRAGAGTPEVVLPAYCCPDVLSAARFVGLQPVLVDFEPGTPHLDLDALAAATSSRTVAVIAIDFLGIPERTSEILDLLDGSGAMLVVDSCQSFPESPGYVSRADYEVWSFGRGKPISLLHGGAVTSRAPLLDTTLESILASASGPGAGLRYRARIALYTAARRPRVFGMLDTLGIAGRTRYRGAGAPRYMHEPARALLAANVDAYRAARRPAQERVRAMLAATGAPVVDVAARLGREPPPRLLRYPVLCAARDERDSLLGRLRRAGLGASAFYGAVLPDIPGTGLGPADSARYAAARSFADRLLTIPIHSGITEAHLRRVETILAP